MTTLTVGNLHLDVRRSDRRRTLGLTVERDGKLVLTAPSGIGEARLTRFVRDKRLWIYRKLAAKEALPLTRPAREFVTGEGFPYLGRAHRLQLVAHGDSPVKLEAGRFKMRRADAVRGREAMVRWYTEHARAWLTARAGPLASRVRVAPSAITVQDLGFRWGSCGKGDRLYFHWQTILLPPRIVDYVLVHELVHLRVRHHTPAFWRGVESVMPDWGQRRRWLADHGGEFIL